MIKSSYTNRILDNIPNNIFVVKVHENGLFSIETINKAQLRVSQKTREEIIGHFLHEIFPEGEVERISSHYRACIEKGERISYEEKVDFPPSDERYFLTTLTPVKDDNGIIESIIGTSLDITNQKLTEHSLRKSEEKYRGFIQNSSEGIYLFEFKQPIDVFLSTEEQIKLFFEHGYMSSCNDAMAKMYGYEDSSFLVGKTLNSFFGDDPLKENFDYFKEIVESDYNIKDSLSVEVDKDGNKKYILNSITGIVEDGLLKRVWATQKDVTTEKIAEKELQESLSEKNTLLSEIHHRVKNNLAVVSGMMQLQAFDTADTHLKEKLYDSVVRIKTMATVHELLYQSQSFSKLEFSDTLVKLVENISQTLQTNDKIEIDIECEPIQLNINQAIPASLVVNEVLTNSYKHAFPDSQNGKISFRLFEKDQKITIAITDDGKGFAADYKPDEHNSLGVHLIQVLCEQIDATYSYHNADSGKGTYFSLSFQREEAVSNPGSALS